MNVYFNSSDLIDLGYGYGYWIPRGRDPEKKFSLWISSLVD